MLDTVIFIQARMGSSRLPGKVLKEVMGKPMLAWQIESLKSLEMPIVVTTSSMEKDNEIVSIAKSLEVNFFRGSERDVFSRFSKALYEYPATKYIRITGDCPLVSPSIILKLKQFQDIVQSDYASNTMVRSFPIGEDVEIFTRSAFQVLENINKSSYQIEHPTAGFYQNIYQFKCQNIYEPRELGHWRWTIDYESDFVWFQRIIVEMGVKSIPEYEELIQFISKYREFLRTERDVQVFISGVNA
jgi:spore coat polysaccharide biosynthesis protein SpsF